MALGRRGIVWLLPLGVALLTVVALIIIWGGDLLIPLVTSRASATLGRSVTIAHLHVVPGRILQVTADDVTIGNPPDWTGEPLVRLPHFTVQVDVWTYLRHQQLVVPLVVLDHPQLTAIQLGNGAANYRLQLASRADSSTKIGEVRIDDGEARVRLAKLKADMTIGLATRNQGDQAQLVGDAHGTYNARPITAHLVGGALLAVEDASRPWPIDLRLQNGATQVTLVGTVLNLMALQGVNLKLHFAGPDMSQLSELTGLPLPRTPNYQLTGQLDFANQRVQLRNFIARVGSSDLAGSIEVDPKVEPPDMTAELTSRRVDLADLGGFIGSEPGRLTTPGQTASQRAEVARAEAQPKLIPDTPINVPKLRWANIHLHYRGQSIEGRSVPLDNLDVRLDIKDGQVTLHPLSFGVGKGHIVTSAELTPRVDGTHARADIEFQRVDVSRLMAAIHTFQGAGAISGFGTIDAVGNSLAQMLDNGHGAVRLAMVGGDLSALLVDLSGLEFGNALLAALGVPKRAQVECFITEAGLDRGEFRLQSLLDTSEAIVTGTGGVNLRSEQLDLQLRTESKHFSIGSLPAPINIGGTLKKPAIMPGGELALRGGAAIGLGFLFPPLAMLPTIQFGTGEDHRCDRLLARAKQQPGGQHLPRQAGPRRSVRRGPFHRSTATR
jgi:AsmA family protein